MIYFIIDDNKQNLNKIIWKYNFDISWIKIVHNFNKNQYEYLKIKTFDNKKIFVLNHQSINRFIIHYLKLINQSLFLNLHYFYILKNNGKWISKSMIKILISKLMPFPIKKKL